MSIFLSFSSFLPPFWGYIAKSYIAVKQGGSAVNVLSGTLAFERANIAAVAVGLSARVCQAPFQNL